MSLLAVTSGPRELGGSAGRVRCPPSRSTWSLTCSATSEEMTHFTKRVESSALFITKLCGSAYQGCSEAPSPMSNNRIGLVYYGRTVYSKTEGLSHTNVPTVGERSTEPSCEGLVLALML